MADGDPSTNGKQLSVEVKEEKLIIENQPDNTLNVEEVNNIHCLNDQAGTVNVLP